jgi:hypothetical protein
VINHLARVPKGRAKNAQIRDEDTIVKEKSKMGVLNWLKGLTVKPNDDGSIKILDDDKEVAIPVVEETKVGDTVNKVVEETKEEVVVEEEIKDKETIVLENKEKKEEKDAMDAEQIKLLKDEIRAEMIAEFKAELKKDKSVFDDVKVIETNDGEKEDKILSLNFQKDEELRKLYWDKMTNPVAHGGSFKALNAFRQRATDLVVR